MYGILRFGVGHTSMLATPKIAQFALGDLAFIVHTLTRCEGFPPSPG